MDFQLNEEQLMMRTMFRDFAQKEVKPLSYEFDKKINPLDCLCWELVEKASKLGLRTLAIPEALGGVGADLFTRMIIQEELGAADLGFADLMRGHGENFMRMNEAQRKEFLPAYLSDDRYFDAVCRTEPDHGTDAHTLSDNPAASTATFAQKKGSEYILNGRKQFTSHGSIAKIYFVHARTDRNLPIGECESIFIIPWGTPGLSRGKAHNKLGRRLLMNGEVLLDDVHVPESHILGVPNKAAVIAGKFFGLIGLISYACIIGFLRNCVDETFEYANTRIQGGKPIIQHISIANQLANMKVRVEAGRLLLWKNAWSFMTKQEYDHRSWLMTKGFIAESTTQIVNSMVDIFGGIGTDKDSHIEKYVRDAYTSLHVCGTNSLCGYRALVEP